MNNTPWWHPAYKFFDPDFYLKGDFSKEGFSYILPLNNEERTKREVDFVIKYLKPKNNDKILDCPCGYGRHALE